MTSSLLLVPKVRKRIPRQQQLLNRQIAGEFVFFGLEAQSHFSQYDHHTQFLDGLHRFSDLLA